MSDKNSNQRHQLQQSIGFVLLMLLAVGLAIASSNPFPNSPGTISTELSPDLSEIKTEAPLTVVASVNPIHPPKISSPRLFKDVEALAFERYSASQLELARLYIIEQLQAAGWTPQQQVFENGINLYADRSGTDPEAGTILVAAHYDTVAFSPGADDNATGVATVLEIARLFKHRETVRSLRLAFFDQEESGLWGSIAFSGKEDLRADLKGVIIADMIGYACHIPGCQHYPANIPVTPPSNQGDFIVVVGDVEHLPLLNAFNSDPTEAIAHKSLDTTPVLTIPIPLKGILMPDTLRSDHAPFWYQGVGATLVTDTANLRNPHYHQPTDIIENLDREFFLGSAQLIVNTTTTLLESDRSLETVAERSPIPSMVSP
jgi:hypothetical protein